MTCTVLEQHFFNNDFILLYELEDFACNLVFDNLHSGKFQCIIGIET